MLKLGYKISTKKKKIALNVSLKYSYKVVPDYGGNSFKLCFIIMGEMTKYSNSSILGRMLSFEPENTHDQ
jgi:hypothetical protein